MFIKLTEIHGFGKDAKDWKTTSIRFNVNLIESYSEASDEYGCYAFGVRSFVSLTAMPDGEIAFDIKETPEEIDALIEVAKAKELYPVMQYVETWVHQFSNQIIDIVFQAMRGTR